MATVVKKCDCKASHSDAAAYQEKKYQGSRVMNLDLKKTSATCTVCGKVHKV